MLEAVELQPDPEVVEALEFWLDLARAGQLRGVVLLGELSQRRVASQLAGDLDPVRMLGASRVLEHRLLGMALGHEDEG